MQGLCAEKKAIGPESGAIAALYSRSPTKNPRIASRGPHCAANSIRGGHPSRGSTPLRSGTDLGYTPQNTGLTGKGGHGFQKRDASV